MLRNTRLKHPDWKVCFRVYVSKGAPIEEKSMFDFVFSMQILKLRANIGELAPRNIDIKGWVVAGASKRGWTTWMVTVMPRVKCKEIY